MAYPILVLIALVVPQSAEERPFLGVTMAPYTEKLSLDSQTFSKGILIQSVVPESAAERAGLQAGDVIVGVAGVDLDREPGELVGRLGEAIRGRKIGDQLELTLVRDTLVQVAKADGQTVAAPDALKKVKELVEAAEPGVVIEYRAERVRKLITIVAELGPRPGSIAALRKKLPPNERIIPGLVIHEPTEQLVDALLAEFALEEAYQDQRQRLASLVDEHDWYCLERFAYVMREPFTLLELARRLSDAPDSLPALLAHAGDWLDLDVSATASPKLDVGLSVEGHARQIERVLQEAHTLCEQAFTALTDDERQFLDETIDVMAESVCDDIMIQRDPDRERFERVQRLVRLAPKVERDKLVQAARLLAALCEPAYLDGLHKDLRGQGPGIFHTHKTDFGDIVFAGDGNTWFQQPAAVVIDLGGDDFYTNATPQPISVVIDMEGNDAYEATFPRAQGCGVLGVALLCDLAGDDSYISRRWGQGTGVFGVGALLDHAGNDVYRGSDFTQGAAFCGVGLLLDEAGDDQYFAERFGQGLGLPGGFGGLIDRTGNDHYYCKGRDLGAYGTPGIFAGWGQGCGVGFRGVASGGVALLLDEDGDDIYEAGNFSQGNGYYFGWGCLTDRAGNDRYLGSRYGQASAAHQAIAYLEDFAGDDVYQVRRGVGQSSSWDLTVTALIDHAGDDRYSAGGFALGAAAHNGLALFVDAGGQDSYEQNSGTARAGGNDYHGGTSLSLILDLGGAPDHYAGDADPNDTIRHTPEHGFFADVPRDLDETLKHYRELIER
ncbi:MAG: PDZ domain-containing protein [Planctomycetota bacterium]